MKIGAETRTLVVYNDRIRVDAFDRTGQGFAVIICEGRGPYTLDDSIQNNFLIQIQSLVFNIL